MLTVLKNSTERILLQKNIRSPVTIPKNYYASEAKLPLKDFKLYKLDKGPPSATTVTKDDALLYYRQMKVIRDMETVAAKLYRDKQIRGFCHLASGQEACNVGMRAAMRPQDSIISAYRVHGIAYTMGISVLGVLAELTGRKSGCVKGKGGSMHMYCKNFYGGNGIVGSQVPLGAGIAFASKYLGSDGACFTLYGDGAANQGQVFEAYNLSKLLSLPVIYVCENNHYAMGTAKARGSASIEYYKRGDYIPGIWVDGMSILEVREGCRFAIEFTKTNGPIVMELETYRYHGHSMSDPGVSYRSRDEIQTVRQTQDPINMFKDKIIKAGLVTEDDLKNLDNEIKAEIADATKHALNDPEIPVEELAYDIYSMSLEDDIRGCHPWQYFKHKLSGKILNL